MEKGTITLPFDINKDMLVIIKDVSVLVCSQCGESFVEMSVARVVEKIYGNAEQDGVYPGDSSNIKKLPANFRQ
jgi:YgiT-type zinc finger domain-containing protein